MHSVESVLERQFLMDEKEVSIEVAMCCCEVNLEGTQFSIGEVCNFLEVIDNIYAIITPFTIKKEKKRDNMKETMKILIKK